MKTLSKFAVATACFLLVLYFFIDSSKVAKSSDDKDYYEENGYEVISEDTTWRKGDELNFNKPIAIVDGKTLTIEKGAMITFSDFSGIEVDRGRIVAEGTVEEKIIFKKENEDDFYNILLNSHEYQSFFRYVVIEDGGSELVNVSRNFLDKFLIKTANAQFYSNEFGSAAIEISGGKLHAENCEFIHSLSQDIKIEYKEYWNEVEEEDEIILAELEVINSNFSAGRAVEAEQCDVYRLSMRLPENSDMTWCKEKVYLKNNYYGDPDGPNIDVSGEEEDPNKGFYLKGDFKLDGWSEEKFVFEAGALGASSVLFLPGIKASHLYKYDSETDHDLDELWVPNWFGNDVDELKLGNDGKSIEKVFTKEGAVLDEIVIGNLYKSFLADLNNLKADGVINDYKAFAYDWRQSVEDIAKNGTPYENNEIKSIVDEINDLAQNSKSGKVTIVAHSNGGLVTKAVMAEYPVLAEKVDKIILVASPQMGTPLATLSFLYGYEESLPTLLSQSQARSLIENMSGAYGLLPSDEYLKRQKNVGESLINFSSENTERGKLYKDSYGDKIDSLDEFREFLLGVRDEREKPKESEINLENILNDELLDQAISIHDKLDSWTPPASVKVIQLGGWGLPTVNGINYVEKKETKCRHNLGSTIPVCYDGEDYILIPEPKWTVDGDRTVTTPSALTMPEIEESENIKKYWFDVKRYNKGFTINREHKNILEADDVRIFIKNEIISNNVNLPEYISTERPNDYEDAKPRIRMSLYSPLDIHLESDGKHTGLKEIETSEGPQKIIEENIPNSYYFQLGERKYVGFEEGEDVEIKLDGYGDGAYTLKIEEIKQTEGGEEIINHVTFKNLPTSVNTKVEITIPESGMENISDLKADYDGNNITDYILTPVLGGEVTLPDTTPPSIEISSPQDKTYLKNEIMDIDYAVFDDRTNAEDIQIEKLLDDRVITQDRIDLSLLKVGEHKLAIKAIDEVDNVGEKEIVFNIATDVKVLRENINHFYDLKLIKTNQERKTLTNNLEIIEREIDFYNSIKNNIFIKSKIKKILLEVIENQIENHINTVIKKIEKDKKNYVTIIKEVIVNDLEFIKNSIK